MPERLTEHAAVNRESWAKEAASYVAGAERNWATAEITWGILDAPESEVQILPDVAGKDVVELGCGTAYVSAWLARRGARPVGVDLTAEQLETARRMQAEHGLEFPLVHASAEDVPLPDASFDLAVSEYGASIWCDPDLWVAEAARLLRPGGELVFLVNGTLLMLTSPDVEPVEPAGVELLRPYFGMRRFEWEIDDAIDFHLGYGDWIRVLTLARLRGRAAGRAPQPGDAAAAATSCSRRSGRSGGRPRRCGRPARSRERSARAAAAPRLDLAAAARDPRAARAAVRGRRRRGYEEHDPPDADPVELVRARTGEGAVGRGRGRRPTVLGVDTTVVCGGRVYGKASRPEEAAEMLAALGGATHEVVSGLCLITPGWEELHTRGDAVTFRPLTAARHRRVRRVRRVGGTRRRLRDPGPRRRPRRADRGRLPERRRAPGRAARPLARRPLPRGLRTSARADQSRAASARLRHYPRGSLRSSDRLRRP